MAAKKKVAEVGDSALHALVEAPVTASYEHGGVAEEAYAWGSRWLIPIALDGASKYVEGTWAFSLVDAEGRETSRTVLEKLVLAKVLVAGDELVLILGGAAADVKVEVYRQTPAGTLERTASRAGDAAALQLWSCERPMIAIGEGLVLAQDREAKALVVHRHGPGFALSPLSSTKIEIGEKSKFIDNEGFSGVALEGARAILAGPAQKTGYQLVDLADPTRPAPIATVKSTGAVLQECLAFVGPTRMLAWGSGGLALFLEHEGGKLTAQKAIKVGQRFEKLHREGDACLLYDGNLKRQIGYGLAPGRDLGKITLPVDACAISAIGDRVMFTGTTRSVIVRRDRA